MDPLDLELAADLRALAHPNVPAGLADDVVARVRPRAVLGLAPRQWTAVAACVGAWAFAVQLAMSWFIAEASRM